MGRDYFDKDEYLEVFFGFRDKGERMDEWSYDDYYNGVKYNGKIPYHMVRPYLEKCIEYECTNHKGEGSFVGDYCAPCHRKNEEPMNTLYEVKFEDTIVFATKLAVNSNGFWVMEEKSTGKVFTARKEDVEEVTPYTVDLVFHNGQTTYSYLSEAGKYEKGDIVIMPGYNSPSPQFAFIVGVDTKSKKATRELKPIGRLTVDKAE